MAELTPKPISLY